MKAAICLLLLACDGATPPELGGARLGVVRLVSLEHDTSYWGQGSYVAFFEPEAPDYHQEVDRAGDCRLLTYQPAQCELPCDGLCVAPGRCVAFAYADRGAVTAVSGGETSVWRADPSYRPDAWPSSGFPAGERVRLSGAGLDLDLPVPPPLVAETPESLSNETDTVFSWTPSGTPGARVSLRLLSSDSGHGSIRSAIIACETDDAAGRLVVDHRLVAAFPALSGGEGICVHAECPPASLARIVRQEVAVAGGVVAVSVGHGLAFYPEHLK